MEKSKSEQIQLSHHVRWSAEGISKQKRAIEDPFLYGLKAVHKPYMYGF